ncbi:MAG: GNAT family N-acetyltransferase [Bacteroidales bacterium]|jgi:ribosomal protein S18 acetylase RimI-like enzyme|nr:GNAT family N-acetyltransferase [Bacteroidales bacterium]
MIRNVGLQDDFSILADLLNCSFATVAKEFGLTKENAPTNNAFITGDALKTQLNNCTKYYIEEEDGKITGFIAIERSSGEPDVFYIEKVAVHPDHRHKGTGRMLMDFASDMIVEYGGKSISIGLINANKVLKEWYRRQGFRETGIRSYDHLPFKVCMMNKEL